MNIDKTCGGVRCRYSDWWVKNPFGGWNYRNTFELSWRRLRIYWRERQQHNRVFHLTRTHMNLMGLVIAWA